jgi:hypothetical protein
MVQVKNTFTTAMLHNQNLTGFLELIFPTGKFSSGTIAADL